MGPAGNSELDVGLSFLDLGVIEGPDCILTTSSLSLA